MRSFLAFFFVFLPASLLLSQNDQTQATDSVKTDDKVQELNEVVVSASTILGSTFQARNRTGSASYISPEELAKFNYTDINRVLRSVPGVNYYEEDGFGLRPNISLRGTSPERSAKITVMEDGVLIAPAPYSAPAAYYFPTIGRMQAVEILKGSSQIQYGPFTTGGAINMVSREIPSSFAGRFSLNAGNFGTRSIEASIGDSSQRIGYVAEYFNYNSDGFKNIDGGDNSGFDKSDYLGKIGFNTREGAKTPQSLVFKIQFSEETSNETYLGLTDEDYELDPYRRYAASQADLMTTEHQQYQFVHSIRPTDRFNITTTGYLNKFKRNWYKLDYVNITERVSINDVVSDPDAFQDEYQALLGIEDTDDDVFGVKANNRQYESVGIQSVGRYQWGDNYSHTLELGLRYHEDEEDRFQWVDGFAIQNGEMIRTMVAERGTDANRISDAKAFAAHALYKLKIDELTLTPGLRFESITQGRTDYGKEDPERTGMDLSTRENSVSIWIPGIGAHYNISKSVALYGGVHKGFAPPGSQEGQDPEESVNYELGTRFQWNGFGGELTGFYNDYENLLGSDLAASGGTGSLDQFNAGRVRVSGLELLLNYDFLYQSEKALRLPLTFSYTHTSTEFRSSFDSAEDIWGIVTKGDELPYIAPNQFNLTFALEHPKFELVFSGRYTDTFRTQAGQGPIPENERVDANFIVDFSARYFTTKRLTLAMRIINLFDTEYAVARVPAGLRPGHPFGIRFGLEYRL